MHERHASSSLGGHEGSVADDCSCGPTPTLPPQVASRTFEAGGGAKGLAGAMGDLAGAGRSRAARAAASRTCWS